MVITMRICGFQDGSGRYWTPYDLAGQPSPEMVKIIDGLGHPPCTDGCCDPPEPRGWMATDVIGEIVYELAEKGHLVVFHPIIRSNQ